MAFEGLSLSDERSDFSKNLQTQVNSAISRGIDFGSNTANAYATALTNTVKTRVSLTLESRVNKVLGNNPLSQFASRTIGNLTRSALGGLIDPSLSSVFKRQTDRSIEQGSLTTYSTGSGKRTTLTEMQSRKDPLLSIDWIAFLRDRNLQAIEPIYIDSLQLPSIRVEQSTVYRQGINVNYAGGVSVDNCTMNLFNDRTGKALKLASSWINSVYNFETGNYGSPAEYKKDITVYLMTVTGDIICQIDLVGCFPTSFNSLSLTNASSDLMPVVLDLSVDMMYLSGA